MATVSFLLYITYHTIYFQYFTRVLRVEYITVVQMCFVAIYDSKKYVPGIKQSRAGVALQTTRSFHWVSTSSTPRRRPYFKWLCAHPPMTLFSVSQPLLTSTLTLFISGICPVCADYNFRSELSTSK